MESIGDLFGRKRTAPPKGRVRDERAELIAFFAEQGFKNREQKLLVARAIGVRLSHYSLSELYALKSSYVDRLNRNGKGAADRFWWWTTKTIKIP